MGAIILAVLALAGAVAPVDAAPRLVIIQGLGGDESFAALFKSWGTTLVKTVLAQGVAADAITYLAPTPLELPAGVTTPGAPRRAVVRDALLGLARASAPDAALVVVLIGHGTARGEGGQGALFNVPGPDISAADFNRWLEPWGDRPLAVVNTTSASGPFISSLSGPERVVITATASAAERYFAEFGGAFTQAVDPASGADGDKNGRVSLLEAFEFARHQVQSQAEAERRLLTEHALLDDDGDGEGSAEPSMSDGDGALAAAFYLTPPPPPAFAAADADADLIARRQALLDRIDALRRERPNLDPQDYRGQLETLLVELALVSRQLAAGDGENSDADRTAPAPEEDAAP
ncbi:MAG: hypothetical protein ACFCBW_14540 [Candidatus Competibacterales bacterium]